MSFWHRLRNYMASLYEGREHSSLPRVDGFDRAGAVVKGGDAERAAGTQDMPAVAAPWIGMTASANARRENDGGTRQRIFLAFDASMPVETRHGLSGRGKELDRLTSGVLDQGKHAIVFGARGSGKTSLARVFGDLADERRLAVLYNSCGGNIGFSELFRPYLEELADVQPRLARSPAYRQIMAGPFDVRQLAILLAETIDHPVVMIIDEFDRVTDPQTKHHLAGLMKMLSDTRTLVRIVVVGIAANLDDLLTGHPSLRRHMVSLQVGRISSKDLNELLNFCCDRAGLAIDADAAEMIVKASLGSPFHLRLFGLHSALVAEQANGNRMDLACAREGLAQALQEWSQFSPQVTRHYYDMLKGGDVPAAGIAASCVFASFNAYVSEDDMTAAIMRITAYSPEAARSVAQDAMHDLLPILQPTSVAGQYMFADSLAPQFLLLAHNGIELPIEPEEVDPLGNDFQWQLDTLGKGL